MKLRQDAASECADRVNRGFCGTHANKYNECEYEWICASVCGRSAIRMCAVFHSHLLRVAHVVAGDLSRLSRGEEEEGLVRVPAHALDVGADWK